MRGDPILDPTAIVLWAVDHGIWQMMNTRWGWPIAEIVHFTGLCLLIGAVGMFDLRMMGVVRGLSMAALHRLVPFGILGFLLSASSGFLFVVSAPDQYLYNPAFQTKLAFMALAGLNMILFYATTARAVKALGPDDAPPRAARIIANVSLASWFGVIACGRVITAFRPPFEWCFWCG